MRTLLLALLAALLTSLALPALVLAQDFREDFEGGVAMTAPYHKDVPAERVAVGTQQPASGKQYARLALPGTQRLEGFSLQATGLPGARLATVSAQVRGQGELWLCLYSSRGWLYAPTRVTLTDRWQTASLSRALPANDKSLGIFFLSEGVQPGAVFEVDDVRVALAAAPETFPGQVGPWRLEAEDYAERAATVRTLPGALGGKCAAAEQYVGLGGLPFPRSSEPVTVYVRTRAEHADDACRLVSRAGGATDYVQSLPAGPVGQWQWQHFAPLGCGELGDSFGLACTRGKAAAGDVAVDSVVISSRADLTEVELAAAPLLSGRRPAAIVARAAAPPTLDGKGDDPCWRNTVACGGFTGVGGAVAATAPTSARLCYDEANLYVLFECAEPILVTAQQRRHEFCQKVTTRDGEVYADDSAVLLLDPQNTGKQVFDFTVNTLGTVADARGTAPDLWESRDLKYNSGVRAQGQVGEGSWSLELAIPFADLGGAPRPGAVWQACLGRIARARKESSSWNLSARGFHDPVQFGALLFGGAVPGVVAEPPASLQVGANSFSVALTPVAGRRSGVYLLTDLGLPQGTRHECTYAALADQPARLSQRFDLAADSEVRTAHAVLDAATLQPLALTAATTRAVKCSLATLTLSCAGPYELLLNDELLRRGTEAKGLVIQAPLQKGTNVFALKAEQGTAAARLQVGDSLSEASSWRLAPADAWTVTAGTDDGGWPLAPGVGTDPACGAVVGTPGKPALLRRTVLWEHTRVWPTPEPAFYLARGAASHLTFTALGLKGRRLGGWTTYLAVPRGFEVVGSTGFYGRGRPTQPLFQCQPVGEQTVNGKPLQVAKIVADKPLVAGQHEIMSQFEAFVRCGDTVPDGEYTFTYWSEANEGSTNEPAQSFKVRLLPKLQGGQCRQLVFQLWGGWLSNMDDLGLREEVLRCAQAAGFNDLVGGDLWTSQNAPRYGLKHTMGVTFQPWSLNLGPYLKEHPADRLLKADGTPAEGAMCTTLLLGAGWPALEAVLKQRLEETKPNTIDYDYEFSPYAGPHSCYCPRCLQAFREAAKLPEGAALEADTIRQKYSAQWVDFMCRRVAQLLARLKETTHRLAPGTLVSTYSGYQTPDNPERYGIDWRYLGQLQAVDSAGAGYGRPLEGIRATIEALRGIPLHGGALVVPYELEATTPQTPLTKAWLLRVLLDSTGGVLVYDRLTLDGRSWWATAEATRLAAACEEVFLKGRRGELPGQNPDQVQTVSDGQTTLVCVLNQTGKAAAYKLSLPAGAGGGKEFYSGAAVSAGQPLELTLPPGEAAVYVLRR